MDAERGCTLTTRAFIASLCLQVYINMANTVIPPGIPGLDPSFSRCQYECCTGGQRIRQRGLRDMRDVLDVAILTLSAIFACQMCRAVRHVCAALCVMCVMCVCVCLCVC